MKKLKTMLLLSMLVMLVIGTISSYAESTLTYRVTFDDGTKYRQYASDKPFYIFDVYGDGSAINLKNLETNAYSEEWNCLLSEGIENLTLYTSYTIATADSTYVSSNGWTLISTTHDILDQNGNVFFYKPTWTNQVKQMEILTPLIQQIQQILPFLVGLVILSIAFWKGLTFLKQTISRC